MLRNYLIVFFILICVMNCNTAYSSPTFEVKTSSNTAEKGHTFQIFVEIKTDEQIHDIVISVSEPEGFYIEAIASPGLTTTVDELKTKEHSITKIESLGQNSSITASFKVWPPDMSGNPKKGDKLSLYSTRDLKNFPINVFFKSKSDSAVIERTYTTMVSLKYTTSIAHYLLAGLGGVFLGFIVKILTQYKQEIVASLKESKLKKPKVINLFVEILVVRLPLLLTLLIIGFGILLSLAKDALPITSWHQAIALGIGIGILSDEQLITKIKKIQS